MTKVFPLLLCLLLAAPATAQPLVTGEPETIHSDASRGKDEQFSRRFVQSLLQTSYSLGGQFTRWRTPICVRVSGMTAAAGSLIERRIRAVATQVGTPVDSRADCTANVSVIVTTQPQARLDMIAATRDFLLQGGNQAPVMRYPVQVWYAAFRVDNNGFRVLDIPREFAEAWRDQIPRYLNDIPWSNANDSRLQTGEQAEIAAATVMVDIKAVSGTSLGALGDYLALLTLAQTPVTGRCQTAPSIANLFLKDCPAALHTDTLSPEDMAMLTALYQTPEAPEKLQMSRLVANMRRNLEAAQK